MQFPCALHVYPSRRCSHPSYPNAFTQEAFVMRLVVFHGFFASCVEIIWAGYPLDPVFLSIMKIYCQAVALSTHHLKMIQWDEHKVFDPSSEETETGETGFLWLENIIFGKLTVSCRNLCAVIIFYLMCRCYCQYSYRQRDAAQKKLTEEYMHL